MKNNIYELAKKAVTLLKQNNMKVSTAESCTGGLVSAYITAVSGSSDVFEMGLTSYSCRIKNEKLNVKKETLELEGAVSANTARQMAENIKNISSADVGLSVTGVAGPNGSEGHEAGLVFIAASYKEKMVVKELNIEPLGREYVREKATEELLKLLIKIIGE